MPAGVFVSGGSGVPGGVVEAFLHAASLSLSSVEFNCASEASTSAPPGQRYEVALLSSPQQNPGHGAALAAVSRRLLPGATLFLHGQVGLGT